MFYLIRIYPFAAHPAAKSRFIKLAAACIADVVEYALRPVGEMLVQPCLKMIFYGMRQTDHGVVGRACPCIGSRLQYGGYLMIVEARYGRPDHNAHGYARACQTFDGFEPKVRL